MNAYIIIGLVGAVASVLSLLIPERFRSRKILIVALILLVSLICGTLVLQNAKISRMKSIEKTATRILTHRDMNYTNDSFVEAALVFLEMNQDVCPEAYSRAKKIYQDALDGKFDYDGDAAIKMEGILKGLVATNTESKSIRRY